MRIGGNWSWLRSCQVAGFGNSGVEFRDVHPGNYLVRTLIKLVDGLVGDCCARVIANVAVPHCC
jgi:hypothetical protein